MPEEPEEIIRYPIRDLLQAIGDKIDRLNSRVDVALGSLEHRLFIVETKIESQAENLKKHDQMHDTLSKVQQDLHLHISQGWHGEDAKVVGQIRDDLEHLQNEREIRQSLSAHNKWLLATGFAIVTGFVSACTAIGAKVAEVLMRSPGS